MPERPVIALIGAGAVGSYYGGRLAQHGQDVHFLLRSDYDLVKAKGLTVQSCAGDFRLEPGQLKLHRAPGDMPRADVVLVTLKTTANDQFEQLISPLLHDRTAILTLQNGLGNEDRLAELFGAERVIGGLAFVCINRLEPGLIRHTDYGLIKIGEFGRPITPRLRRLSDIFNASNVKCQMLENLAMGRWEKLVWNVPFNGLGAALDATTDVLVGSEEGLRLVREIMQEVVATAHAEGVMISPDLVQQNIDKTLTMGPYRSSMQIDRQVGRPMEHEAIIGEVARRARKHGVNVPQIEFIYRLLTVLSK
jgi:2-dehydropantoate 2-reductase